MGNYILPGYYRLNEAIIENTNGNRISISNLMTNFSIEESIDSDCMKGSASFLDAIGLLENFALRGEEKLTISVEDPLEKRQTFSFRIYKIDDIKISSTRDSVTYKLHFVSSTRYDASFKRIIRSFEKPISSIVKDIFKANYGLDSTIQIEDTEGMFKCVIPNYTPQQAMNFLSSRSYSSTSPSCSFRFFETSKGYFFVSDEYLIKEAIKSDSVKEFSFTDNLSDSGSEFINQMQNLTAMENSLRANSLNDLYSGAYTNNVIEIDILRKKVTNKRYSYSDNKSKYFSMANSDLKDIHTDEFIQTSFNQENERKFLLIKDYSSLGDIPGAIRSEQFLPEIISNRLAYRHHLHATTVVAVCPGRLDLNAGDLINVKIPELNSSSEKSEFNMQLSGNYILHSLKHDFSGDVYQCFMKFIKYDWSI